MDAVERFFSHVDASGVCWEWTARRDRDGYGRITWNGKQGTRTLRVCWEILVGPVPEGMQLDHLCRNRGCVNPDHAEPVPQRVNVARGFGITAQFARRESCANGHDFTPENTRYVEGRGRICRACARAYARAYRARRDEMSNV